MPLKNLKCKNRLFAQEPLKCTNGHRLEDWEPSGGGEWNEVGKE